MIPSAEQVGEVLARHWDSLGGDAGKPSAFSFVLITKGREAVGKLVLLAFADDERAPRFAIKLPRLAEQNAALDAEYRNLSLVAAHAGAGRVRVPRALLCRDVRGSLILVESVVDGIELSQAAGASGGRFVGPVADWLIHLGRTTVGLRPLDGRGAETTAELLSRGDRHARSDHERRVLARVSDRLSVLDDRRVPRVFEQRDMGTWNLLVATDGSVGVLDWESAVAHGFPVWDLFYFLAHYGFMVHRARSRQDEVQSYRATFLGRGGFAETSGAAIRRYRAAFELRPEWLLALLLGCWLHHTLSEATRLGIRLSESLFWDLLQATLDGDDRPLCWG